jgi:hypothetical protein
MRAGLLTLGFVVTLGTGGASAQAQRGGFTHENNAANLQRLMETVHRKLHVEKSVTEGAALFRALVPDEARVRRALRDDVAPGVVEKVVHTFRAMTALGDAEFGNLMRPGQRVVRIRGATTEEIGAYREGSIAYEDFPSATQRVANQLLRPGLTFYEVEFLEPGQPRGIKYHLFYWDGQRWTMLGPVWRAVQ